MLKKVIWTLNIDDYAPQVTALTYPLLRHYAEKIGADFQVINQRSFPEWPVVYEKLQIHYLGVDNDWNIYIDSDALIHPDMFDPTNHVEPNTVLHNGSDLAGNRWKYDRHFRRDGRHIGSCNWFTAAPRDCIDLWRPLDMSPAEARANIYPIVSEINSECFNASHLIDDYALSRNIAMFGLKFTTVSEMLEKRGVKGSWMWHAYTIPVAEKVRQMKEVIRSWGIQSLHRELEERYALDKKASSLLDEQGIATLAGPEAEDGRRASRESGNGARQERLESVETSR